jgi:hypothetical protein
VLSTAVSPHELPRRSSTAIARRSIPVFGLASSAVIIGEQISALELASSAVVLAGLGIDSDHFKITVYFPCGGLNL